MSSDRRDPVFIHYEKVREDLLPWVRGRGIRTVSRGGVMEDRGGMRIEDGEGLLRLVAEGTAGLMVSPLSDEGEVWCFTRLRGVGVPFEAVRLTALKLRLALRDSGLDAMAIYDGDAGLLIGWSWGVPDPDEVPGTLTAWHETVAGALRSAAEERLTGTPERERIGRWLGFEAPVTLRSPQGAGVLFEALGPGDHLRVPFSLHPGTGRGVVPLALEGLYRFEPAAAAPRRIQRLRGRPMPPLNFLRAARTAFTMH
ncbi:MAG: hypothetical protein R6W82_09690 [bacterium]